jgi:lauroyl/myristoyl acyltransferase
MLEYVPDRLAEPKWMSRCHIEGLDPVLRARQNGRPVIFAFFHSSAYRLSRFWLRAAGIPAANLIAGKAENRSRWDRLQDGFSPFPGIPTAFYLDQLREVNEFLAAGNSLLVALDHGAVKRLNLPVGGGWTVQMDAGAIRLAIRHRVELIPFVLIDEGRWHYQIKLGRPVPADYLTAEADWTQAGKHLLGEMLPHFRKHPQQFSKLMASKFQPPPPANPMGIISR